MSYRRFPRRRISGIPAQMLALECRRLLAAVFPTDNEQYLVELINRGRANPTDEAARYGIALNEGLSAGTISTAAKQPLAINPYITDAARDHSQWMIDTDTFSHNEGANDPGDRMAAAGYNFTGSWTWGENIGWSGSTGSVNAVTTTAEIHENLFVDENYPGRGHRVNLMKSDFREIGAGVVTGQYTTGQTYNAVMVTEDFGKTGTTVYLTGVAYNDNVTDNDFYTPGEGLSGVTIKATRAGNGATYTTTSWSSGGYSLAVPAGTYTLTASGGSLGGSVTHSNVVVGTENVKRDFTPSSIDPFATITGNKLTVVGTTGVDSISVTLDGNAFTVTRNGTATTLNASGVTAIDIVGYDGDDYIVIGPVIMGAYIDAGAGEDYIQGGDGPDTITSGAGKDRAFGGLGDDRVAGNGSHDKLNGEAGKDRLYGGEGNDTLDGGSSGDRFWGDAGNNTYYGQGGDDRFYARNSLADVLYGQSGYDYAQTDGSDSVTTIEELLA